MEKQDKLIENIFINIISSCAYKKLKIGDMMPAISFNTYIKEKDKYYGNKNNEDMPVLIIDNFKLFIKVLNEYVTQAVNFYYNGFYSDDNIKLIMSLIFANASINDLKEPIEFLNREINFLKSKVNYDFSLSFLGYNANIMIKKNKPLLESPYSFNVEVYDEDSSFFLPQILFGISNKQVYIYAIQNKDKTNSKLKRKINRLLYKINNGYIDNCTFEKLNTNMVTMSFLAAITIFLKYVKEININYVNIPIYMPIRYKGHEESFERRKKYYKEHLNREDFLIKENTLSEKEKIYKENVTYKLYRTFLRIYNQSSVLKVIKMTENIEDGLIFEITDGVFNNDILNSLYQNTNKKNDINGKLKN